MSKSGSKPIFLRRGLSCRCDEKLGRTYNAVALKRERLGLPSLPVDSAESRKTHCAARHPYDEQNTYWTPGGHRHCRACTRLRNRERGKLTCKKCAAGVPHALPHGTRGGYSYHGCRCAKCVSPYRQSVRENYWRHRDRELDAKQVYRVRNYSAVLERERRKSGSANAKAAHRRTKARHDAIPVTRKRNWTQAELEVKPTVFVVHADR